ncbi:MAG: ATP-binding cassette domain-containing protein [Lactobacillaceae bacterium]|jgi:ATP-binding cassette subfamily B protein|nr:ATP-binding cassette domain-containing protein [Lactobacillaceae bacterium]
MRVFIRLSWFIKREWKAYLLGMLSLMGVSLFGLITPVMIGRFADGIASHTLTWAKIWPILAAVLIATVGQYIMRFAWSYFIWGTAARLEKTMRNQLFTHYLHMDATFFQKYRTGDLLAHATNDISQMQRVAGNAVLQLFDSLITGLMVIIAMIFVVDGRLTLVAVVPLFGITLVASLLGSRIHNAFMNAQAAFSTLNNKTQESIMGIKALRTLGQEEEDIQDFSERVEETIKANRRAQFFDSMFDPAITLLIGVSYVATIIVGGSLVLHKSLTIGQLITFVTYLSQLIWPFMGLGFLFNNVQRGNASLDRIEELLSQEPAINDDPDGVTTAPTGTIKLEVAEFRYPDANELALENIQGDLPAGQTLGLVGQVGAGKSTLLRLLLREFDQYTGTITVNGIDIRHYKLDAYLPAIGYVPQDNFLFSTTVRENIRFADPSVSDERVEQAARWANLHTDILSLPDGYDTQVGEQGISLSGGQRQRLAIARALIINPEILILDDALSAVDAKTEKNILDMLTEQRAGKTTIISTHRLSAVVHAYETLVMDHGRIIERGNHSELIAQHGWYEQMYVAQQIEAKLDAEVTD